MDKWCKTLMQVQLCANRQFLSPLSGPPDAIETENRESIHNYLTSRRQKRTWPGKSMAIRWSELNMIVKVLPQFEQNTAETVSNH